MFFVQSPVFSSNTVDPDQTPHSAAPDLGVHAIANVKADWPMLPKLHVEPPLGRKMKDARHKWVKVSSESATEGILFIVIIIFRRK